MGWKQLIGLTCLLFLLTACTSKEAEEFIEQESTFLDAQKLVENAMKEEGLNVTVSDIQYDKGGKSVNTERVVVIYETEHEPVYNGRAYLHVDKEAKPRQFSEIDHLGLEYTEGFVSISDMLTRHISQNFYQITNSIVEDIEKETPDLIWEGNERFTTDHVEWQEEKLSELLNLYGEGELDKLSEEEAVQWFKLFQVDPEGEKAELHLNFTYSGEMTNNIFEQMLQKFTSLEDVWPGTIIVRVQAEQFDESEEPVYNYSAFYEQGVSFFEGTLNE